MELDFAKICRVCLNEGLMMSIFKVNVSKKMMACASVQVNTNKLFVLLNNNACDVGLAKRRFACSDLQQMFGETAYFLSVQEAV